MATASPLMILDHAESNGPDTVIRAGLETQKRLGEVWVGLVRPAQGSL